MGRYVRDGHSWQIERDGTTLTITEDDGTAQVEQLANGKAAATRFTILTNQKLRAGWKLWKPPEESVHAQVVPDAPVVFDAREALLEAAIFADPEAIEPYLVYGDWLQQQGDPRGELIARYAAWHADQSNAKLKSAIGARLAAYREYFYGPELAANFKQHLEFAWGFVRHAQLRAEPYYTELELGLAQLCSLASARFLVSLELVDTSIIFSSTASKLPLTDALPIVATRAPSTLRWLRLRGTARLADIAVLAERLTTLRHFGLRARCGANCFTTLARTPMPQLRGLELECPDTNLDWLAPVLARTDLPALTELVLAARVNDQVAEALEAAPCAAQLTRLELRSLDAGGALRLLTILGAFPNLRSVGVHERHLAPDVYTELASRVRVYEADDLD